MDCGPQNFNTSKKSSTTTNQQPSTPRARLAPLFSSLQTPWKNKFPLYRHTTILHLILTLAWCLTLLISTKTIPPVHVSGTYTPVSHLTCSSSLWLPNPQCGPEGVLCGPFNESISIPFHCPRGCASRAVLSAPYHAGPQTLIPSTQSNLENAASSTDALVIGGPLYRGDSWICAAAFHDGTLEDDSQDRCAVLTRFGQTNTYPGGAELRGLKSVDVQSYFPVSFRFVPGSAWSCQPRDWRWGVPLSSVTFSALIWLLADLDAVVPFGAAIAAGWAVLKLSKREGWRNSVLYENMPGARLESASERKAADLWALALLVIMATLVYRRSARKTLSGLQNQGEKTLLWLGAFWFGLFSHRTLTWIPFSSFLAGDDEIKSRIRVVLVLVAFQQMQLSGAVGTLRRSWPLYTILLSTLFAPVLVSFRPDMTNASITFSAFGLILMPAAAYKNRSNLVAQGLLVGLLLHILSLSRQGQYLRTQSGVSPVDGYGVATPDIPAPHIKVETPPVTGYDGYNNITLAFDLDGAADEAYADIREISILVNDAEKGRAKLIRSSKGRKFTDRKAKDESTMEFETFTYWRGPQAVDDYVRASFVKKNRKVLGYGNVGVWEVGGDWVWNETERVKGLVVGAPDGWEGR